MNSIPQTDLVIVLPHNVDFPFFRYYVRQVSHLYKKVIIARDFDISIKEGYNVFLDAPKEELVEWEPVNFDKCWDFHDNVEVFDVQRYPGTPSSGENPHWRHNAFMKAVELMETDCAVLLEPDMFFSDLVGLHTINEVLHENTSLFTQPWLNLNVTRPDGTFPTKPYINIVGINVGKVDLSKLDFGVLELIRASSSPKQRFLKRIDGTIFRADERIDKYAWAEVERIGAEDHPTHQLDDWEYACLALQELYSPAFLQDNLFELYYGTQNLIENPPEWNPFSPRYYHTHQITAGYNLHWFANQLDINLQEQAHIIGGLPHYSGLISLSTDVDIYMDPFTKEVSEKIRRQYGDPAHSWNLLLERAKEYA